MVSWADIITPDSTVSSQDSGIATGVVKIDNQLIIILDFEKIVSDISPETGLKVSDIEEYEGRERSQAHVISVEDSPLLLKSLVMLILQDLLMDKKHGITFRKLSQVQYLTILHV